MKHAVIHSIALLLAVLPWRHGAAFAEPAIIVGGASGTQWIDGGGTIPALVITADRTGVEQTNAPGGVVDFAPVGRNNWIFPRRADTTVNIALGANNETRGGSITSPNAPQILSDLPALIDGDPETALDLRATETGRAQVLGIIISLDLGARFGLNRFRLYPRNGDPAFPSELFPHQNEYIRGYEILVNDGTPETQIDNVPVFSTVAVDGQNEDALLDLTIEPQYVRYVRVKSITNRGFEIAELELFGTGYVPESRYLSNVFDFGEPAILGKLRWVQESIGDPGLSGVQIRTRTGHDGQPVEFNKLRPGETIFRQGGGLTGLGTYDIGQSLSRPEVPWKDAADVADSRLRALIENTLDNEEVDVRQAREIYKGLSREEQEEISLTAADYAALGKAGAQDPGQIRDDVINWSPWSPPYPVAGIVAADQLADNALGVQIASPSPRQYFQFSIEFTSEDFEAASGIGGLAFEAIPRPFAGALLAEVAPRTAALGQATRFVYAVLSQVGATASRGFDRFRISTPLRVTQVGPVSLQGADGTVIEADFSGVSLDAGSATVGVFTVEDVSDDGFTVGFPRIDDDETLLRVDFDAAVLRFGTVFRGTAFDSETATEVGQEAIPGNVDDLSHDGYLDPDVGPAGVVAEGNLSVAVDTSGDLLINVSATPAVFSPNGDGINDVARLGFDVTNITTPTALRVEIHDLAGRRVRVLVNEPLQSGRYTPRWDGRDDHANLVPPGIYLFAVTLEADTGSQRTTGLVHVAY